jgi:hypothetical protein
MHRSIVLIIILCSGIFYITSEFIFCALSICQFTFCTLKINGFLLCTTAAAHVVVLPREIVKSFFFSASYSISAEDLGLYAGLGPLPQKSS